MNWTFCWLPFDSSSARRSARTPGCGSAASHASASRRARSGGSPYSDAK